MEKCIYAKFASERKKEFAIQTSIVKIDGVKYSKKKALYPEARKHIKRIVENCEILTKIYGKAHVAQCVRISEDEVYTEFIDGMTVSKKIEKHVITKNLVAVHEYLTQYVEFIKLSCKNKQDEIVPFDIKLLSSNKRCVNFDLIFDNIIDNDGNWIIIDYEWLMPVTSYKFVLYRTLKMFVDRNNSSNYKKIIDDIVVKYDIKNINAYDEWIYLFESCVINRETDRYKKKITCDYYEEINRRNDELKIECRMLLEENNTLKNEKQKLLEENNVLNFEKQTLVGENNILKNERRELEENINAIKNTKGYRMLEKVRRLLGR